MCLPAEGCGTGLKIRDMAAHPLLAEHCHVFKVVVAYPKGRFRMAEQPVLGEPVPVGVIDVAHATVGTPDPKPNVARQIKSMRQDIRRLKTEVEMFNMRKAEKAAAAAARKAARPAWYYPAMAAACVVGTMVMLRDRLPDVRLS